MDLKFRSLDLKDREKYFTLHILIHKALTFLHPLLMLYCNKYTHSLCPI